MTTCVHNVPILEDCLACEEDVFVSRELRRITAKLWMLLDQLRERGVEAFPGPTGSEIVTHLAIPAADGRVYRVTYDGGVYEIGWGRHWEIGSAGPEGVVLYFVGLQVRQARNRSVS